jgi:hypothetical protein
LLGHSGKLRTVVWAASTTKNSFIETRKGKQTAQAGEKAGFQQLTLWSVIGHSCAMTRMLPLLLSIILLSCPASAADRTLVAEGDYVAQSNPHKPLAHWKVWHLRTGDYEVIETLAGPSRNIVQVFDFDAQFLPSGFSLTIDTRPRIPTTERQKLPFEAFEVYPTIISCRYNVEDLSCQTESNGKKSALSIPAKLPYVFIPGEFYALDETWLATGIVRLNERHHSEDNAINVYTMLDNKIRAGRAIQLTYAGKRTANVMGKFQAVTEYEVWRESKPGEWVLSTLSVLLVTSQGLVARIRGKSEPGLGYAISNYKEYESWLPSR